MKYWLLQLSSGHQIISVVMDWENENEVVLKNPFKISSKETYDMDGNLEYTVHHLRPWMCKLPNDEDFVLLSSSAIIGKAKAGDTLINEYELALDHYMNNVTRPNVETPLNLDDGYRDSDSENNVISLFDVNDDGTLH